MAIVYGSCQAKNHVPGADQINLAVNHVNEISVKNREEIAILIKEVSRFKVE